MLEVWQMTRSVAVRLQSLFETVKRPDGRRWTLQQLAEETGLSVSYVWRLRSGRAGNPTKAVLDKLAEFFGVPVSYFVEEEEQAPPPKAAPSQAEEGIQGLLEAATAHSAAGRYGESEAAAREALEKAQALGLPQLIATALDILCRALANMSRLAEAEQAARQALQVVRGLDSAPARIRAMLALAFVEYSQDRFRQAYIDALRAQAEIETVQVDTELRFLGAFHTGTIARRVGRLETATAYLERARALSERLQERHRVSVLANLGLALLDGGQPERALECFKDAHGRCQSAKMADAIVRIQHGIGLALEAMGRWEEAIEWFVKSLGAHEAIGSTAVVAYNHMELGACYARLGRRDQALHHAYAALALAEEHERQGDKGRAHWHVGRALALLHEPQEATRHYAQAVSILEQLELDAEFSRLAIEYGDLLREMGDAAGAAEAYRKAALAARGGPAPLLDLSTRPAPEAEPARGSA